MPDPNRNTSVDLIRAVALVGICVVNLPFHALPAGGLLGQAHLLPLAVLVAVLAMGLTGTVAQLWGRAPFETLPRRITYGPP